MLCTTLLRLAKEANSGSEAGKIDWKFSGMVNTGVANHGNIAGDGQCGLGIKWWYVCGFGVALGRDRITPEESQWMWGDSRWGIGQSHVV